MNEHPILPRFQAGYWISPNNYFFTVEQHIFSVCDAPAAFGTTEQALQEVFEAFGEIYRREERAREVIIRELVRAGWIRLRNYVRAHNDYWSVNLPSLSPADIARLCVFMQQVYRDEESHAPVRLNSTEGSMETAVNLLKLNTPTETLSIPLDALPRLVYVSSPATLPRKGIPMIDLTQYAVGKKMQQNNEGTAL